MYVLIAAELQRKQYTHLEALLMCAVFLSPQTTRCFVLSESREENEENMRMQQGNFPKRVYSCAPASGLSMSTVNRNLLETNRRAGVKLKQRQAQHTRKL